ncbi:MAG: DUF4230 domain-containing protein [Lachnospiraceae bacterium]|nr:DUF4230 domain-containing protein [Lachnospiraceae bacterium]
MGKVMGSLAAMADFQEAFAEGKNEGLSAKDTTAEIANKIQDIKRLEVMVASVKITDMHSIGDDYAALYLQKGDVVVTVDLSMAEIVKEEDVLHITIPEPEIEFINDHNETQKVAEYQKHFFSGNTEAGYDAFINTMAEVGEKVERKLNEDDAFMKEVKESARKQVTQLAKSVSLSEHGVKVDFQEAEGMDDENE